VTLQHRQRHLDQHQDPREFADRFASQAPGVTGAVQPFVMLRDRGRNGRAQRPLALRDQLPGDRVRMQISPTRHVERFFVIVEGRVGMHHPDVV